jgi:hypothetical protein
MATTPSTNINIPYSPFIDPTTGRPAQEWLLWLMNPNVISFNIATALPVTSGGTGLSTIPTNGQLLIGNGTGYTLNPLTPGSGITIGNGAGTISVTNSGVLSILAGSGISASTPAGNVTVTNTGVLSFAGGSTGLTPAAATVGAVSIAGTLVAGYGGTGLNTYAVGDIIYASGATALSRLADVATGNALISGGVTTAPSWGKIGLTTHVSGTLPIGNGGTNGTATPTAGAIAYGTGSAIAYTAAGTTGQVLTSATAGTPTWTTPTTGTVTAVSVVSANGLAGSSSGGATPALTLSTTVTGLLKGNGTAISAAASGTDYAPATSGTSILYGNGAGGFSNVTIGTGVAFAGGTLSATGSGGTVTSVTGTAPVVSSGGATPAISMPAATTSVNGYLTSTDWNTFNGKGNGTVTSVGFTGGIITVATPTTTPALTVAGTSGGIPYFSSTSTWATSAALAAGSLVLGGGAGVTPATTTTGTGVVTALGVNTGTAGAFVVNGGALGTPSSGTVTNLTGTASININGTVGATTPAAGSFTTLSSSGTSTMAAINATGSVSVQISGMTSAVKVGALTADTTYGAVSMSGLFDSGMVGMFGKSGTGLYLITPTAQHVYLAPSGSVVGDFSSTGLAVTGALSKSSGSFRIPHPLPALETTNELVHSFIEGPQADLIYRGKVNLVDGKATINIDTAATMTEGTFVILCRDVQCFTSNETDWNHVRGSVNGNILTVDCQDPASTALISWMVIGERQDKHMMETEWTDNNGKVIVEPLKPPVKTLEAK